MHKPQDQAVSVGPSLLFSSRNISESHLDLIKLLSASLLWSSKYPQLSELPAASPGIFMPLQQVQGWHRAYLLTLFPEDVQDTPTSIPHWWHGAHGVRRQQEPHTRPPMFPAEPTGDGCGTTERGQTTGHIWGQRGDHDPTHRTSPSWLKRASCGHGVSGDCLDPVAKTFIACLGHL